MSNVFINSLWLNILDSIVLVNAYTVDIWATLLNELKSVDENNLKPSDNKLINLLLYGDPQFDSN